MADGYAFSSIFHEQKQHPLIRKLKSSLRRYRKRNQMLRFYRDLVPHGSLCFDIGANKGDRTKVFLDLGAEVVTVEPVSTTFEKLSNQFSDNHRVKLMHKAIGSARGRKEIHVANVIDVSTFSAAFIREYADQKEHNLKWDHTEMVDVITLDNLIEEFGEPAFCKIDVEGYELEVLKGLSNPINALSLEYNARRKSMALECLNELDRFPNRLFNCSPYESMQLSLDHWHEPSAFKEFIKNLPLSIETGDIYVKEALSNAEGELIR